MSAVGYDGAQVVTSAYLGTYRPRGGIPEHAACRHLFVTCATGQCRALVVALPCRDHRPVTPPSTTAGRLVPRDTQLVLAVLAGCVWVAALVVMAGIPELVREATLYRQGTGEGVVFFQVVLAFGRSLLLLLAAAGLSGLAHGFGGSAPLAVRATRLATWALLALLLVGTVAAPSLAGPDCFRTCAPFPE